MCLTTRSSSRSVKIKACIDNEEQLSKDAALRTLFPVVRLRNVLFTSRPERLPSERADDLSVEACCMYHFFSCLPNRKTDDRLYVFQMKKNRVGNYLA